jgi:hypothetical protein
MPPFQLHFGAGFLCSPERLNMGTWALESRHGPSAHRRTL